MMTHKTDLDHLVLSPNVANRLKYTIITVVLHCLQFDSNVEKSGHVFWNFLMWVTLIDAPDFEKLYHWPELFTSSHHNVIWFLGLTLKTNTVVCLKKWLLYCLVFFYIFVNAHSKSK